jgi:mono/diheme cytochrome c family protein
MSRHRTNPARHRVALALALASALALTSALTLGCRSNPAKAPAEHLDFNQDVQPILASNCFSCHGPDPEMRKAGLRLDLAESAFRKRPGHPDAIVPGHPEQSELIRRIESKDPHALMPQTTQGEAKPMKPEEIAILKEWIKEGAVYRPHWAFDTPVQASLPAVDDAGWAKNPIDRFVLARLQKEGLHPSPEADKATLIRRVTLDLTGLLPTPGEVKAFLADNSPNAYEHLVDGLLARPSYGEERTRYWLDYARYGDTYGIHTDFNRDGWPYRDYLIRAFNSNKPFDQFAMEQIAGDMMPAKTLDSIIASGYVRSGASSNEGGAIPEEMRVNIARERTEAYGAAFLGLTVGCAVCHDHKYDPTTQKDFYALSAFFNNIDEMPFNDDRPNWWPIVRIPKPEHRAEYDRVLAQKSALEAQLADARAHQRQLIGQWLHSGRLAPQAVSQDELLLRLKLDEGGGDVLKNSAPHAQLASFPIGKFKPMWGETTWLWPDFRLDTTTHVDLGQTGDFEWNQPFSTGGWMMLRIAPNFRYVDGSLMSKMDTTRHYRGWDMATSHGIVEVSLVDESPKETPPPPPAAPKGFTRPGMYSDLRAAGNAMFVKVEAKPAPKKPSPPQPSKAKMEKANAPAPVVSKVAKDLTPKRAIRVAVVDPLPADGAWRHLFFTYDGSGRAAGVKLYIDGKPVATRVVEDTLHDQKAPSIRTTAPMQLGWRYPDADPAHDTRYQDIRLYARALSADEVKRLPYEDYAAEIAGKPVQQWNEDQWHEVGDFYFNQVDATTRSLQTQIATLDQQLNKLSEGGDITLVSSEKPSIAYADILTRGVYTARAERVEANTPHFLPPLPAGEAHNRLALAKWTVSSENPLTARVTVNRMWNEVFGTGLVETTEDFGIMGGRPSNPELLDWLAVEFRQSGWNIKHMYKLMVMSAAYRQSGNSTPQQLAKDPKNLLLAHGPRFRMDAEMLRDIALESSGLLVDKIGGPSVKPYQPPNIWETVGIPSSDTTIYRQDHGDALYRRSMYTYWKRMAIMPDMEAFDAPARDVVCTRRQRTDTPLQALVTLNDTQWVEASRALAERVIQQGGKQPEQRLKLMSDILLAHDPPPKMMAVLQGSLAHMQQHYAADPKAAHALIAVGEKRSNPNIPAPELAAWTMVASEMLNLDETVTK